MIYICLGQPKSIKKLFRGPLHSKLKKIQGLFKDLHSHLRTFQGKMEFKDFLRTSPKIQGLFKTVPTPDTETINGSEVLAQRVN